MAIWLRNTILSVIVICLTVALPATARAGTLRPEKRGERYGYINEQGRMVILPRFAIAMEFGEGLAYVAESPDRNGAWRHGFIDTRGRWVAFLEEKSFRPASSEALYYGRTDCVVFCNGFVELPSFNSTGSKDFETSSVWMNRHQMLEMVERFGKETRIRPTSRIFFSKLLKDDEHILGVCAKANNTKGPNGILVFDRKEKKPATSFQAGEVNEWYGGFGILKYTGGTCLIYRENEKAAKYFDEVTVVRNVDGKLGFIAKGLEETFMLYTEQIEKWGEQTYETVEDFLKKNVEYTVQEMINYGSSMSELQSRKMMNFETMSDLVEYYLVDGEKFNDETSPICMVDSVEPSGNVRIEARCGAVLLTDYSSEEREAWLWNFSTTQKMKVRIPLVIDARGRDGENGKDGSDGAAGRAKLTYKEGNVTKTEPGTCGEKGDDGKDGKDGDNGATLLVIMDNTIPANEVIVNVDGGKGGKGGAAGKGGIHGNGSSCKGKADDGKQGNDGKRGNRGEYKIVRL